ncbi:two component transcriptional regulator, LytTR family [Zhouia amylolytica]|uniref:Response regulator of the LytR/AlgR family n=2 Tax=Zhouia amylolytica TaxID=376730 RepID=W2UP99_9FLAO|nr:LytTR family DNA-binding domain-containing protein [Zhouia amylolytica]ETN96010.1 response regulator of the LytR/AlgR family [Zhouia amylolytica AD3]MCQ0111298.1 response regulator transcription factor [Zhouia amylolytica]SFS51017.1 two component transcriptional regulator, LytTR family [Zhouia amylolytica]
MKVIIIEDEAPAARRLKRILQRLNVEVSCVLHSIEASLNWFENNRHPDLIFLDIQLSDGLSFEIFENIEIKSAVIFTTAYDEYALQAFKLNSIDYLLKPIDEEELEKAVAKYEHFKPNYLAGGIDFDDIKKLLVNPLERTYKKRFSVKVGQHIKLITVDEIECFYSQDKTTFIHIDNGRSYPIDLSLEALTDELSPENFFRVSRKFFINIGSIKDILDYSNNRLEIKLKNFREHQIVVSRERVRDFKDWIS